LREQDRQLARKHRDEERQQRISRYRSELLAALERIKHQDSARRTPDIVVLTAGIRDGKLILPWDADLLPRRLSLGEQLRTAERLESAGRHYDLAADTYRAAATQTKVPEERAYAKLLAARAARRAGRQDEAAREYLSILRAGADVRDEYGVPFALYAAPAVLDSGGRPAVLQTLSDLMRDAARLGPAALYRMRDLAAKAGASESVTALQRMTATAEQAEALQSDFPKLLGRLTSEDPVWMPYGEPAWLLSLRSQAAAGPVLVAVSFTQTQQILSSSPSNAGIVLGKAGEPLGDMFPGLHAIFPNEEPRNGDLNSAFLSLSLTLVMGLTLFAGYLLWRAVRRDARLAELRSEFVSSVSHELRTPLTSIRMFTERMRLDDEMPPEDRAEYLDTILRESERLSRLVENALRFSRIEQGKSKYDLRPASVAGIAEHAVRAFGQVDGPSGIHITTYTEPAIPEVLADRDALQQAILNLLSNAVKYSGESREVTLRVQAEQRAAAICVIDHGVGIAPDEQARIFEPFYRTSTAENQHIPGTGLGLTLVDHIAKAHGGAVSVESRPGEGSTFTIRIPFVRESQ
jgi:signal transduction histidine kinase